MSYSDKSRQRDFDQHAFKIRLGLEELKDSDSKRAIWELFQNAVDLSDKCHIRIVKTSDGFKFEHNGKPFMDDSLASLIKQVTNKQTGTQDGSTGQYGTGFITTHVYGKRIELNGFAEAENGYVQLDNFLIDRKEDEDISLSEKIMKQDKLAGELIDGATHVITKLPDPSWTSFHYIADANQNSLNIYAAIEYLKIVLPLVFIFNDRLSAVDVYSDGNTLSFRKEEPQKNGDYWIVDVTVNDEKKSFICLFSEDEKKSIRIVLPYDKTLQPRLDLENYPKLFLFYPLIGSEQNVLEYVIHANGFSPQEKRDALYLEFINDLVRPKVEANRAALEKAFSIIIQFLEKNSKLIPNTLPLCRVHLNQPVQEQIADFWEEKKSDFVDKLLNISLVQTHTGRLSFTDAYFFSKELLLDEEYHNSIYSVASQFFKNIPLKDDIIEWSKLTADWNKRGILYLTIENILKEIEATSNVSAISDTAEFGRFLEYVSKSTQASLFDEIAVLPNIYGDFKVFPELKASHNIDDILIKISERLFANIPESFIHEEFKVERVFAMYSREDFKRDMNEKAQEITDKIEESEEVTYEEITALIDFISINSTTEINKALTAHLCKFFNYRTKESSVENHVKDFDYRSSLKTLFRYFIFGVTQRGKDWLENNLKELIDALQIVYLNDDFKKTVLHELKAYPNQNYKLCKREELKLDKNIPSELKEIYFEVLEVDYKDLLALDQVAFFLQGIDAVGPEVLGQELEKHFQRSLYTYNPITKHPEKDEILEILQHITKENSNWGSWFPVLYSQRLEVLVGKIVEPSVQKSMFAILTKSDEMIAVLGRAADLPNLSLILEIGQMVLQQRNQQNSSFQHKYMLGKRIEDIIRNRISNEIDLKIQRPMPPDEESLNELVAEEEQNGQDIVIYLNDKPIYYIEVKSRWNSETPFRISRNQTIRAFDNADKYALISIDMTNSTAKNPTEVELIEEILDVISVNADIGDKIDRSLVDSYRNSIVQNTFHIEGDFRTHVPIAYIESGTSLIEFENILIRKIQDSYAHRN